MFKRISGGSLILKYISQFPRRGLSLIVVSVTRAPVQLFRVLQLLVGPDPGID